MTAPVVEPPLVPVHGRSLRAFPGLDGVRALGAGAVVATHVAFQTGRSVQGPLSATLSRCDIGVALFFVLSGFLLFRPWALAQRTGRPAPDTRTYLWRRALRILPAYWLAVALCLLLLPENAGHRGPTVWLRHLTLTQVYGGGLQRYGLTQAWSLCTEVLFYLLLPLLAPLVVRTPRVVLPVLLAVSTAWLVLLTHTGLLGQDGGQWLPSYLDWFAGGMGLALLQVRSADGRAPAGTQWLLELARSTGTCWLGALAVFAVATSTIAGPYSLGGTPTAGEDIAKNLLYVTVAVLVVLPLVLGDQRQGAVHRVLASPVVLRLGEVSYGVFLWHLLVLQTVTRELGVRLFSGSWLEVFALTASFALVLAGLSYVLVERPALRLKDRVPGRDRVDHTRTSAATHSA